MKSIRRICRLLFVSFGPFQHHNQDPLDTLIRTILSQNTADLNSGRAFQNLKAAFPTWKEARRAPRQSIEKAIACAGLSKRKSLYIRQVITALSDSRGKPSLARIRKMETRQAREFLFSLPGVGMKTASCVLLFALGRPVCPVDTHVLRVAKRLGAIPPDSTAEKATPALEAIVPPDCMLAFHLGLIQVGRTVCRPQRPRHEDCLLRDLCDFAAESGRKTGRK